MQTADAHNNKIIEKGIGGLLVIREIVIPIRRNAAKNSTNIANTWFHFLFRSHRKSIFLLFFVTFCSNSSYFRDMRQYPLQHKNNPYRK